MGKRITFVQFFLIGLTFYCQSTEPFVSKLKSYQPHWRLSIEENFSRGIPKTVRFYEMQPGSTEETAVKQLAYRNDGSLLSETDLDGAQSPLPHGPCVIYYADGTIDTVTHYSKGQKQGIAKSYYPGGMLKTMQTYLNNVLEGPFISYHENGKIYEKGAYAQGKREGRYECFHANGRLALSCTYQQGLLEGELSESDDAGLLQSVSRYHQGLLHGTSQQPAVTYFSPNRTIIETQNFRFGVPLGKHLKFYPDGRVLYSINYAKGSKQGLERSFDSDGTLISEGHFKDGMPVGEHYKKYPGGHFAFTAHYNDESRLLKPIEEFDEAGKLKRRYSLLKGLYDGLYQEWYPSGDLHRVYNYSKGSWDGAQKEYHPNGTLKLQTMYFDGVKHGDYEEWDENGHRTVHIYLDNGVSNERLRSRMRNNPPAIDPCCGDNQEPQEDQGTSDFSQQSLNGEHRIYFPTGELQALMHYEEGLLHGKKAVWNVEGCLVEEANYVNGELEGRYYRLKPDGKEVVAYYKNNLLHGLYQIYHSPHDFFGKMKAFEANFNNGFLHGEVLEFNEAGTKIASTLYQQGKKDGLAAIYSNEGRLQVQGNFKGDKQSGMACSYYPNGSLMGEASFFDDLKHGFEKAYHQNGRLAAWRHYNQGKLEGLSREWNEEGVLIFEGEFHQGKRHGKFNKFDAQGAPIVIQNFADDVLVEKSIRRHP